MKKLTLKAFILAGIINAGLLNTATAQESGFFAGLQGGFGLNYSHGEVVVTNGFSMQSNVAFNLIYGVRLGYILGFNEYNALRFYADFTAGEFSAFENSYYNMSAGLGLDYLLSFTETFGMFIGAGYNYNFGKLMDYIGSRANPHNPYANIGFAWNVSILRIELGAKVPFLSFLNSNVNLVDPTDGTTIVSVKHTIRNHAQIYVNLDFVF